MDELITTFLTHYFTEQFVEETYRSFSIFDAYEHNTAFSGFIDIITDQSNVSSDMLKDQFVEELNKQLDYVLAQHTIKVSADTTITEKNEILTALFRVQALEDYSGIIRMLESFESDEVQLTNILSDLCAIGEMRLLHIIESFDATILKKLKEFIYKKEENEEVIHDVNKLSNIDNLRLFFKLFGATNVGGALVENNTIIGANFETYLPYVENDIVTKSDEQTAINILSLIYLSIDGYNSPLLLYNKYSFGILQDLNKVSKIEVLVVGMINKLTELKKAHSEKNRISSTNT